ncbi:MAG: nuclear transport factor 2 family protein [Candidatus Dormibacteraeota bacterium]|nr:nuclear transport factor 2 family protein [Candidatus Dormibacteraeota bacterium]
MTTIDRLEQATNQHDLEALVGCFAEDYVNETPAHPARGFRGREQVRRNWEQIFNFVPDISAQITRSTVDGDTAWTEWEMEGTRRDGSHHHMRGVIVFGAGDDAIKWARFYLEPVDPSGATVDDAVRDQVARK